jgi:hypothetical protein
MLRRPRIGSFGIGEEDAIGGGGLGAESGLPTGCAAAAASPGARRWKKRSRSKTLCEGPHVRQAGYRTAVKKVAIPVGHGLVQVGSKVLNTKIGCITWAYNVWASSSWAQNSRS